MSKWIFRSTGRPSKNSSKRRNFGKWLKKTLHNDQVTIKGFAEKIGVDPANLYNYVGGRSLPSLTMYVYIVKGLSRVTGKTKTEILTSSFSMIEKDI